MVATKLRSGKESAFLAQTWIRMIALLVPSLLTHAAQNVSLRTFPRQRFQHVNGAVTMEFAEHLARLAMIAPRYMMSNALTAVENVLAQAGSMCLNLATLTLAKAAQ